MLAKDDNDRADKTYDSRWGTISFSSSAHEGSYSSHLLTITVKALIERQTTTIDTYASIYRNLFDRYEAPEHRLRRGRNTPPRWL
ncbi:hypothetical protein M513_11900 [Trichuris suis]|uniref:Uncharacterized protein n=1 Tax=Trichuris suis TaxID=68888 RepID=A0A085LQE7_9BILA|nr:hypothetical protein M513_11900 [Trichuris suis]